MKYTVFFVEDEITIREKIRESITWESTDFEYLGDAPDGESAMTRIMELQPDIVVTDIKMPHMDGLDLCRSIQYECPDTCMIILSGYNDFEYARKAINLNVSEYLLKPITPANLINALNNAAHKIAAKRENKDELRLLKKELMDSRLFMRERFLQGLMTGANPVDAIIKADEFGINLRSSGYSVMVFRSKVYLDISELAGELQVHDFDFPIFRIGYREAGIIVMAKNDDQLDRILNKIKDDLPHSMLFLSNPMQIEHGYIVNRISMISSSFQNACIKIDSPSIHENPSDSVSTGVDEYNAFQELNKTTLEEFLNTGLLSNLDAFLDSYLMTFLKRKSDRGFSLFLIFHLKYIVENFLDRLDIYPDSIPYFSDQFDLNASITDVREQYKLILENVLRARDELRSAKYVSFLSEVHKKIDNEYFDENISLESLAKSVNVNPSYLSTAFKRHYKKTITKYLIEKRMKRAMELLRTSNMTIAEICASIGYNNSNYFSVLFKKYAGKTPREYRNEK